MKISAQRIIVTAGLLMGICLGATSIEAAKKKIGVNEIQYRVRHSQTNKVSQAAGRADTRRFRDMMTTALVKTQKFDVIEQNRLDKILAKQGLDYLITGSIIEYGIFQANLSVDSAFQEDSIFADIFKKNPAAVGFSAESVTAKMAVDLRLVLIKNNSDDSILLADTVRTEAAEGTGLNIKGLISSKQTESSSLLDNVMRQAAQQATNLIVTTIYPIKVIAHGKQETVTLNYGNGVLQPGTILEIFQQGESFIDPDTGEALGQEEELIGKVSVVQVLAKFAKAKILKGSGSIGLGMIARLMKDMPITEDSNEERK